MPGMRWELPDGVIEFGCSGCCCPPREPADPPRRGQHTNCATSWWRVILHAGGPQPWQRRERHAHARILAGAALSCAEFVEAMQQTETPA